MAYINNIINNMWYVGTKFNLLKFAETSSSVFRVK